MDSGFFVRCKLFPTPFLLHCCWYSLSLGLMFQMIPGLSKDIPRLECYHALSTHK